MGENNYLLAKRNQREAKMIIAQLLGHKKIYEP
jgi:hypothetical protein